MNARHRLFRIYHKSVGQKYLRWKRGLTLGARVAVIDQAGRFLMVKQSYAPGWLFPGGGVEFGETCEQAALRELKEEAEVTPSGPLSMHGIFLNHAVFPGDHVTVYTLRDFAWNGFTPTREILAAEFFAPDRLPPDTMGSTRRRIDEILGKAPLSQEW